MAKIPRFQVTKVYFWGGMAAQRSCELKIKS